MEEKNKPRKHEGTKIHGGCLCDSWWTLCLHGSKTKLRHYQFSVVAAKNYGRKMMMPGYFLRVLCVVFLRVLCGFIFYHRVHKVPIAIGITQRAQRLFVVCCEELWKKKINHGGTKPLRFTEVVFVILGGLCASMVQKLN